MIENHTPQIINYYLNKIVNYSVILDKNIKEVEMSR